MQYRTLGKTDISASAIALGTWAIGGGPWWGDSDDSQSVKAIQTAIDAGVNLIDTAPAYGFGHSEEVVGKAIKEQRDKVILSTKCGLWWNDDRGTSAFKLGDKHVRKCLLPETIREEVEISLSRMDTDYIDLYHTHWPSLEPDKYPIDNTMQCLMKLKEDGKIRAIAASNVDIDHIKQYQSAGILDAIQPRYSMLDREIEKELLPYCLANGISTLAYSPLEQGLLTGKIGMDQTYPEGVYRNQIPWYLPVNREKVLNMLEGWSDLLAKYNCSLSQLVIAWTVAQQGITFVLCGARKEAHVSDNVGAGNLELEAADLSRIRKDVEALGSPQEES
ncbi:General stress protein 69 (YhdN) [Olavius sp. associated proteobacterium Delta 1]|nr:General stress protein 69 (YhdN) [Olavius sp. associated proteobacterium Delta 1]